LKGGLLKKIVKVVIVCATGLATSTMAATKLARELLKHDIDAKITKGQIHQLDALVKMGKPDFVVATAVTKKQFDIPVFDGVPLLSNKGVDEFIMKILEYIDTL
jgi:PTS system galactitol-specific IIB component